ncbi:hypothetical protein [Vandammella animalimorsus]|uniref:hypothetical protein n=1 Tax=Vandammella animalimorsus TaxID=2029117 RepID=UPI001177682B|nr:hypothetical protein [Vandammella animalimorsus]
MSKDKKFEDFFNRSKGVIESIDTLIAYDEKHNNLAPYVGNIFCPECRSAQLHFVRSKTPHLRTNPSSQHLPGCSYHYEYVKNKTVVEYLEALTPEQVESRLNAMMRLLMPDQRNPETGENLTEENNPLLFDEGKSGKTGTKTKKTIRRQRLSGWIAKDIAGDLYLFYGDVKITSEEKLSKNNHKYHEWILKTKNKDGEWKYRTKLYRGAQLQEFKEDCVYKIVFIGTPSFDRGYMSIELENRNAVLYREITEA